MNGLETTSLLLRQVAALRRSGMPHDRALRLASEGLLPGPLKEQVEGALLSLNSGTPLVADDPVARLLADGNSSLERLDALALAQDARLWAATCLSTTRMWLTLALAGPLTLVAVAAWFLPTEIFKPPEPSVLVFLAEQGSRWLAPLLVVTILLVLPRLVSRVAPGYRRILLASSLLEMGAASSPPPLLHLNPADDLYFRTRRERVGQERAAREAAEALVREGQDALRSFRHLGPVLGVLVVFPFIGLALAILSGPLFHYVPTFLGASQ